MPWHNMTTNPDGRARYPPSPTLPKACRFGVSLPANLSVTPKLVDNVCYSCLACAAPTPG